MIGILLSYWGGLFSGAMLVSGRVMPLFVVFVVELLSHFLSSKHWSCSQVISMVRSDHTDGFSDIWELSPKSGTPTKPLGVEPRVKRTMLSLFGGILYGHFGVPIFWKTPFSWCPVWGVEKANQSDLLTARNLTWIPKIDTFESKYLVSADP